MKKFLALIVAIVMSLSLVIFPSSAADPAEREKFNSNSDITAISIAGVNFTIHDTYYRSAANIGGVTREIKNLTVSGKLPVGTSINNASFKVTTSGSDTSVEILGIAGGYTVKAGENLISVKVKDNKTGDYQIYTASVMGTGDAKADASYYKYAEPTVIVSDIYSLRIAMDIAKSGQVIGITKGDYYIFGESKFNPRPTLHDKHNVIVRSVGGKFEDVTLWGNGFHKEGGYNAAKPHNEMIVISGGSSDITLYGITIRESNANGYKIEGTNERNITLDTCRTIDINEYAVKGSAGGGDDSFVYNLVIINCWFENTERPIASSSPDYHADHLYDYNGNYVGAIDIMNTRGSYIADNTFVNINGALETNSDAFGAIGFWGQGGHEDTIVERNFIYNCDRGIMLGLTGGLTSGRPTVNRGIVRNNIIYAPVWDAITMCTANDIQVYNNTIVRVDNNPQGGARGIRYAYNNSTNITIKNNIAHSIDFDTPLDAATMAERNIIVENNLVGSLRADYYVNRPTVSRRTDLMQYYNENKVKPEDFILTANAVNAIGKGQPLNFLSYEDFFGNARGATNDIGAYQYNKANVGNPLGNVVFSDITAYINGQAIPTSIINGKTLVVVEDLAKYGFDVTWNNGDRTLKVTQNKDKVFSPLSVTKDTVNKPGTFKEYYVYTDIKTYISGKRVESYAISGVTLINFDDLGQFGNFTWDGAKREIRLVIG